MVNLHMETVESIRYWQMTVQDKFSFGTFYKIYNVMEMEAVSVALLSMRKITSIE